MLKKTTNLFSPQNILNSLLIAVPVAAILEFTHASPLAIFIASAIAIIPLAGLMGRATEHLAHRLGEGIGGLLNATFGNAAELIIAIMALRRGLFDVVKASITGSIIGNILLVLGLSILAGGLKYERQTFNTPAAMLGSTMLALSAIGLLLPAVFHYLGGGASNLHEQDLSLEIAIVLIVTYILSLVFTLKTHSHLYTGASHDTSDHDSELGTKGWSQKRAAITLLVATVMVAVMSEFLVGAVEEASHSLGLTDLFVGVILVAIIGNAAEHSTAVLMAMKNKMDLALNIAIGSSMAGRSVCRPCAGLFELCIWSSDEPVVYSARSRRGRSSGSHDRVDSSGWGIKLDGGCSATRGLRNSWNHVLLAASLTLRAICRKPAVDFAPQ